MDSFVDGAGWSVWWIFRESSRKCSDSFIEIDIGAGVCVGKSFSINFPPSTSSLAQRTSSRALRQQSSAAIKSGKRRFQPSSIFHIMDKSRIDFHPSTHSWHCKRGQHSKSHLAWLLGRPRHRLRNISLRNRHLLWKSIPKPNDIFKGQTCHWPFTNLHQSST